MKIEMTNHFDREVTFLSVDGREIEIPHDYNCAESYTELWPEQAVDRITRQGVNAEVVEALKEYIKTKMVDHRYELHLHDGTVVTRRRMVDKVEDLGEENGKMLFRVSYLNGYDSDDVAVPIRMRSIDENNADNMMPQLDIGMARRRISGLPLDEMMATALSQHIEKKYKEK